MIKLLSTYKKNLITRDTHVNYQSSSNPCSKVISKVKVFKKWDKLQGQGHRVKNNGTHRKVLSQGILMWNIKALAFTIQKFLSKVKVFKEWVKLLGQGHMVKNNGINTRNIHVKYQSSSTHCSKLISKVKVFKKWAIHQGQGQRVKNNGTHEKILSQGKAFTV